MAILLYWVYALLLQKETVARAVTFQEKAEKLFLNILTRPSLVRTLTIFCQPFISSSELKIPLGNTHHTHSFPLSPSPSPSHLLSLSLIHSHSLSLSLSLSLSPSLPPSPPLPCFLCLLHLGCKSHRVWVKSGTEYVTLSLPRLQLRVLAIAQSQPLSHANKLLSLLDNS